MQPYFTVSSLLMFIACLAIGLGYAFFLYRKAKNLPNPVRYVLAACRTIVVTLILWLIFSPLVHSISYTLEKPVILIAQDNSSSTLLGAKGFDSTAYRRDMQALVTKLSEKYEVHPYHFSDAVGEGLDFRGKGRLTNAESMMNRLAEEYQNRNVGALIVSTDGIFNRGGNPVYALKQLRAPVYGIALGDTIPKKDLLIANVAYNELAYLDNDFTVEVQVQAFQSQGTTAMLTVKEDGKLLHEEKISIGSPVFVKEFPIKLHANSLGVKKYTVSISNGAGEVTLKNNTQDFFVEIIDGKQDVLIAADAPHPDISVLRQAIEANKHYTVTIAYPDDFAALNAAKFGTVILFQLPSLQNTASALLDKLKAGNASLWYILGGKSNILALNTAQSEVQFTGKAAVLQEVFPMVDIHFTNFYLSEKEASLFAGYDPLLVPFGRVAVQGEAAVFLHQKIGKIETDNPLWFFMQGDGRKYAFLLGEGLWRWRLGEERAEGAVPVIDQVISKTIQYLSVKDDKRKFRVFPAKPTFDEQESVIINANLYNDANVPVNTPDVSLQIIDAAGKRFNYVFSKTAHAYRIEVGNLKKGTYRFEGTTQYGGKALTASGTFYVDEILAEYQQTTANHEILRTMVAQNGGGVYTPANLLNIEAAIAQNKELKTLSYEDRRYTPLIDEKWLFGLILLLLTGEWFVRKRYGAL